MKPSDTSLGGADGRFPETRPGIGSDWESLGRRYWKPVYAYLRLSWAKSNEDAKDLTQAFFVWLMESDALAAYDRARGGFRPFLKVLLRRFAGHEERAREAIRRGGSVRRIPLDGDLTDLAARGADPEAAFERLCLEEALRAALDRARERLVASDREVAFRLYEAYVLASAEDRPTYAELARRWKLTPKEVDRALTSAREEVRQAALDILAVEGGGGDADDEWRRFLES